MEKGFNAEIELIDGETKCNLIVYFACFMVILTQAGITLYLSSFLAIQKSLNASSQDVAFTLTTYMLGYATFMLFWGMIGDALGKKKALLIALSCFALSSYLISITHSITFFILARFFQGVGGGGCAILGRAAIRDNYEGTALIRGMSYVSMAFVIAAGVCQLLGGQFQKYLSWRHEFSAMTIFALLLIVAVFLLFPKKDNYLPCDKKIFINSRSLFMHYVFFLKNSNFILMTVGGGIGYSIAVVFSIVSPFLLQGRLHFTAEQYGYIGLLLPLGYLCGLALFNQIFKKANIFTIIKVGFLIVIASGFLMLLPALNGNVNIYVIMIPMFCSSVGQALVYPGALGLALKSYKENASMATAFFGFIQQCLSSIAAFIASYQSHATQVPLALSLLIVGSIGIYCIFRVRVLQYR